MAARTPRGRNLALEAAKSALASAFHDRVLLAHPDADQEPAPGKRKPGWQRKLAKEIGVSQSVISELWQGKPKNLRLETLVALQRWLGRSYDEILGNGRPFRPSLVPTPPSDRPTSTPTVRVVR